MNNFIKNIPPLTEEEIVELKALEGREIDFSDIPEITKEEWKKFYKVNPRTPEEWEQYYKNCPPHIQKRYEQRKKKIASRKLKIFHSAMSEIFFAIFSSEIFL